MSLHAGTQHDDVRIHLLEFFVAESHSVHCPAGKVVGYDISPSNNLLGQFSPLGMGKVKG